MIACKIKPRSHIERGIISAILFLSICIYSSFVTASELKISQIVDTAPTLTVFVSTNNSALKTSKPRVIEEYSASLGSEKLTVQSVKPYSRGDGIALVIAVDISKSLPKNSFPAIKASINNILSSFSEKDKIAIVTIGQNISERVSFSSSLPRIQDVLMGLSDEAPDTPLYQAIITSQELASKKQNDPTWPSRRAVLLITDGLNDSSSGVGFKEVKDKVGVGDAPVYSIGITEEIVKGNKREAIQYLAEISRESGGEFKQATRKNINEKLSELVSAIYRTNILTVDCNACLHDAQTRKLQISPSAESGVKPAIRDLRLLSNAKPALQPTTAPTATPPATPTTTPSVSATPAPLELPQPNTYFGLNPIAFIIAFLIITTTTIVIFNYRKKITPAKNKDTPRPHTIVEPVAASGVGTSTAADSASGTRPDINSETTDNDATSENAVIAVFHAATPHRDADSSMVDDLSHAVYIDENDELPGSKSSSGRAITVDIDGAGKRIIYLSRDIVIGRHNENDIIINNDTESSNRHACLYESKGKVMVRDLGSSNGTFLNGSRIDTPEPISDSDWIKVGRTEIRVYFQES